MPALAWIQAVVAAGLLAGAGPAPVSDPARLAALLENPARRGAAFCELLRLQRYRGTPRYRERVDECEISQVVVAPQRAGAPMYLVVRRTPSLSSDIRLDRPMGFYTLVDAAGFLVPAYAGSNGLEVGDELIHHAGDDRLSIAQVQYEDGDEDRSLQVLTVVPIAPEQRPVLRLVIGPPAPKWSETSDAYPWTFAWGPVPGAPPVLQIGPRTPGGQLASVAAEFTYSEAQGRFIGPAGGAAQGFLLLDPVSCCSAEQRAFATALGAEPPREVPRLDVTPAQREAATPCAPGTDEHRAAEAATAALGTTIAAVDSSPARLDAANRALSRLLAERCFRLSDENPRSVIAGSALALRTWWSDGGEDWLRSYLYLGSPADDEGRWIVVPPDMRPEATRGGAGSGLLVCGPGEPRCGEETRGWQLRAMEELRHRGTGRNRSPDDDSPEENEKTCSDQAGPGAESYGSWRLCLEKVRPVQAALPLGRFRAPRHGWFVIAGRRGHYRFCDSLRAYDLATGTAWAAESCSGLALQDGGTVDHAATDRRRWTRVLTGRLPLDDLREAVWMTVLAEQVAPAQVSAMTARVPRGMALEQTGIHRRLVETGGFSVNTGQTQLSWRWVDHGAVLAHGALTWPGSSQAGEDHAVKLLDVAEQGMVEGPPAAPLPVWVVEALSFPGVSSLDAEPGRLSATERALREQLRRRARPTH